ncbi:Lrp/AsnC family transcriptional regulator [Candidatus Woesearchaeota archaeon]|nr:Lrp/AsnC family transcriptional regulator [Candidatus Woesearchaeota archaeon]
MAAPDFDLVFLRAEDARCRLKELARLLRKSSQLVKYRVSSLLRRGVLFDPYCVVDYAYLGLLLFKVYIKGAYVGEKDKAAMIRRLGEDPDVVAVYELGGEYDLVIEVMAENPSRFGKVVRRLVDHNPTLRHHTVALNVVTHLYPRQYLVRKLPSLSSIKPEIIIGGDREPKALSPQERAALRALVLNPTMGVSRLAKEAEINPATMRKIMRLLRKARVVRGCRYSVDVGGIGASQYRIFLSLHNLTAEREEGLFDAFREAKEVINASKTIGDWDLEVDVASLDAPAVRRLTMELRERFKDIIASFNITEFYQGHVRRYLPLRWIEGRPPQE